MASVTWKGENLRDFANKVRARGDELIAWATEEMEKAVEFGAIELQENLEAAVTSTGEKRVAKGGVSAGRHRSGNMVGSISYDDAANIEGNEFSMSFGWFAGDFEEYFRDQDLGTGIIPAANAMNPAFVAAREKLKAGLRAVVARRSKI